MSIDDICLLTIRDGRNEVHERARNSVMRSLPEFEYGVLVDDHEHKLGFAGAIKEGWRQILETDARWVFHCELDFTFKRRVPIDRMRDLLVQQPHLAQVSLKRQAWNEQEIAAGGIVELNPDDFHEKRNDDLVWTEHCRYFTTNPSLYSVRMCELGWPQEARSEGLFTRRVLDSIPKAMFAIWGAKFASPMVHHIGVERAGHGY